MADPTRHALVIATSEYRDERLRALAAPLNDANNFATVLKDPNLGGFVVTKVLNKDAHVVQEAIDKFCGPRAVGDTIVVYFSGHGVKDDDGRLYLAARNTVREMIRSTGISGDWLRDTLASCRAQSQVLLLDCCFGGAFAKGLMTKGSDDSVDLAGAFGTGSGRAILTASNAMQFAFEDDDGPVRQSVFTRTIVDGIRSGEADLNRDGCVSVDDLYKFAYQRIALPGSKQTPTLNTIGAEGEIIVAKAKQQQVVAVASTRAMNEGATRATDLRPWVRIHDVGSEGSSAAMAAVTAMETSRAYRGQIVSLSARYIYQKSKALDKTTPESDSGIMMPSLLKVIERFGTPPEDTWPYVPGSWQLPAGKKMTAMDSEAKAFRAKLYEVHSLADVSFHLAQGHPVIAAFNVFESTWYTSELATAGMIAAPPAGESLIGSVAIVIVDYDQQAKLLRFAHHWGTGWGDRGFGSMAVDAARVMFNADEMWAVGVPEAERTGGGFEWEQAPVGVLPPTTVPPVVKPPRPLLPTDDERDGTTPVPVTRPRRRRAPAATTAPATGSGASLSRSIYDGVALGASYATLGSRGRVRTEGDPPTGDEAVDRVYDAIGTFHQFFADTFDRRSWDGEGGDYRAVVHYGRDYQNGFWDGGARVVVLGDGDGEMFNGFYGLDLIAKEFANGLIQVETGLEYAGESGALHNALSLVFASMVKQYAANQTAAEADWLIGAGLLRPSITGTALMSLVHPGTAYDDPVLGKDPAVGTMKQFVKTKDDNGGIHVNAGIPSRAFALTAKKLGGSSWERAGSVWYHAVISGKVAKRCTFGQFAALTVNVAKERFDAKTVSAVKSSWQQVGVG